MVWVKLCDRTFQRRSAKQAGLMAMARDDARALVEMDPDLASERGKAVRTLLWLMEQDTAIDMISVG